MCFPATANFVGSGVLSTIQVATLTGSNTAGTAFRGAAYPVCPTSVYGRIRLAGNGWDSAARGRTHDMGAAFMLYAQGLLPFLLPLSVLLFEPDVESRRRMLPFAILGGALTLYILWALTAYPLQVSVKSNSLVYINQATNNTAVAVLYVIATCGSLFFSKIRMMVIFGVANLAILLTVMVVKRYAFTSLWCAYAAVASVIILILLLDKPYRAAVSLRALVPSLRSKIGLPRPPMQPGHVAFTPACVSAVFHSIQPGSRTYSSSSRFMRAQPLSARRPR